MVIGDSDDDTNKDDDDEKGAHDWKDDEGQSKNESNSNIGSSNEIAYPCALLDMQEKIGKVDAKVDKVNAQVDALDSKLDLFMI